MDEKIKRFVVTFNRGPVIEAILVIADNELQAVGKATEFALLHGGDVNGVEYFYGDEDANINHSEYDYIPAVVDDDGKNFNVICFDDENIVLKSVKTSDLRLTIRELLNETIHVIATPSGFEFPSVKFLIRAMPIDEDRAYTDISVEKR